MTHSVDARWTVFLSLRSRLLVVLCVCVFFSIIFCVVNGEKIGRKTTTVTEAPKKIFSFFSTFLHRCVYNIYLYNFYRVLFVFIICFIAI